MKFFETFFYAIMVIRTSMIADANVHQHDVIRNYRENEHYSYMERSHRTRREAVLKESGIKLPPDYNMFELPKPSNSAMPLFVFLNISNVLDWDESNEFIRLDLRLKVMWTDFRILEFNNNTHPGNGKSLIDNLTHEEVQRMRRVISIVKKKKFEMTKVIIPSVERLLAVDQPVLMTKPLKIRFIPEFGWFEYITRIQIKIDCSMDFRYYPADIQTCHVAIRSYSYTKSDMNLSWHKMGVYSTDLEVSSFEIRVDEVKQFELAKSDDPHEVHEVLGFKIFARRRLSYHLIQTYLASSFYIVITTLCFLLPSSMIEARIGMSMTTLLTLTAMFASVRESTPIVSYTKAIDIWMVGCIFFVFLTLFQFTFSTWLKHANKARNKEDRKDDAKSKGIRNETFEMDSKLQNFESTEAVGAVLSTETLEKYKKLSIFFEIYSFPLFLGIFVLYSTIYWTWLLTASNHYNWSINSTWNRI